MRCCCSNMGGRRYEGNRLHHCWADIVRRDLLHEPGRIIRIIYMQPYTINANTYGRIVTMEDLLSTNRAAYR